MRVPKCHLSSRYIIKTSDHLVILQDRLMVTSACLKCFLFWNHWSQSMCPQARITCQNDD